MIITKFTKFINETYGEDDINMSYGLFGTLEVNFDEKKSRSIFDQGVKDLQKKYKLSEESALKVLNSKMGRKAADQIIDGQADSAISGLETYYTKTLKKELKTFEAITEAVARDTKIYCIATPAPKSMLVEELEELFGDDYRNIITEFKDDEGYESVLVFDLTKRDIKMIQENIADVLIWEYSIKKGKEVMESVVTEGKKLTLKRRYTENHPAITAGKTAKIRNKILEAIKDGKMTQQEFDAIIKEMTVDSTRWKRRNSKYFNVSEDGISLSKFGSRILKGITVNEKAAPFKIANVMAEEIFGEFGIATLSHEELSRVIDLKRADKLSKKYGEDSFMALAELDMEELLNKNPKLVKENNTNKNMKTTFLHESFSSFVENSHASVNEAFGSMKLAELFKGTDGKLNKSLAKAFYQSTAVAMDKVQDEDLITTDPQTAYKAKQSNTIIFYISDNQKENPYFPSDSSYVSNETIPGGGYLLAVASGDNKFYDNAWASSYSRKGERTLKKVGNNPTDSIGISKKYKGWGGTGLYNVKRIAEVADRAIVINVDLLQQKYSTANKKADRAAARTGATAFKSDKDFKQENKNRYEAILQNKAVKLPLDKMVSDAIDELTAQIKDGLAKGEKGKYGDLIIGTTSKGREAKMRDASNHMSRILDNYARYVDYVKQEEASKAQYGESESWYAKSIKEYAKQVKDDVNKIKSFDYAW